LHVGTDFQEGTCRFSVWAPNHKQVTLWLPSHNQHFAMQPTGGGYWTHTLDGIEANTTYLYQLDGKEAKPDPASNYQPDGVFGPSAVIDHDAFHWKDTAWHGLDISDLVFYEVHVGAFTAEGTFKAILPRIRELKVLGINALELMPVTQFSGSRNWGYDGVFPFSVQNTYGTPDDLKALVNECHLQEMALFIDFVYNHLGPEGNCLNEYGPYFPISRLGRWGPTVNLDGPQNEGVRNYFLENTLHWFSHYHIDGIRLDAVLAMVDSTPKPFLSELTSAISSFTENTDKKAHLIAESGYNQPHVLAPPREGGFGFDAQWLDDFQHALFALLTAEKEGYYKDYGTLQDLIGTLAEGFVYVGGEFDYKRRTPDQLYPWVTADKLIVFNQNHDQIGNRLLGDRLLSIAGFEAAKLAAGMVLLSPYMPLLFMGEEYGETTPFLFFTDYQSKQLAEAIGDGRRKEFAHFHWQGQMADPQNVETFEKSKLNWQSRASTKGQKMVAYYRTLLQLRQELPLFHVKADRQIKRLWSPKAKVLFIQKQNADLEALVVANFSGRQSSYIFPNDGTYTKILDSADLAYGGPGATLPLTTKKDDKHRILAFNLAVYQKGDESIG
jgi:maltooligosyltrehalose trehalohydrolase